MYSELQYRGMTVRDARRRAELFPSYSSEPPPVRGPQQAAAGAAPGAPTLPANPAVSIIVPALNEEAGLEATLRYLQRELSPPAAEIIVVDGGSTDRTAQVARRCGVRVLAAGRGRARQMNAGAAAAKGGLLGRHGPLHWHVGCRCHAKRRCMPWCMVRRAVLARLALPLPLAIPRSRPPQPRCWPPRPRFPPGDVLIFVHADTRPPPSLLPEALAVLRRPQVVLGGFRPVIGESRLLKAGPAG